jgi:hypothetical protein
MRQVDAAFEIIEWLRSPGSQAPERELVSLLTSSRKTSP